MKFVVLVQNTIKQALLLTESSRNKKNEMVKEEK
jgi:hypothetical protein